MALTSPLDPVMAMDFKTTIYKSPFTSFFITLICCWALAVLCLCLYINNQKEQQRNKVEVQLGTFNRVINAVCPNDTLSIKKYCDLVADIDKDQTISKITATVYDLSGEIIATNADYTAPINFENPKDIPAEISKAEKSGSSFSSGNIDPVTQSKFYSSVLFDKLTQRIIVTEAFYQPIYINVCHSSCIWIIVITAAILLTISIMTLRVIRRHKKDFDALYKILAQISNDRPIDTSIKFSTPRVRSVAQTVIQLEESRNDIIRRQTQEREDKMKQEQEKLKSKRMLSNNLNHEIKTPIGIIQGYLDTLLNHPEIKVEMRQSFIKKCIANVLRLQNMAYNITLITRIEDGSATINMEDVNMRNIAELSHDDLLITLADSKMTFNILISPDIYVESNETIIYNIINNLVKNSCLYSEGTTITLEWVETSDNYHIFHFHDNGKGVDDKFLPSLFNRFCRIDHGSKTHAGSGLGLAIVKESIELCGGTIQAENKPTGGLKFIFKLPCA